MFNLAKIYGVVMLTLVMLLVGCSAVQQQNVQALNNSDSFAKFLDAVKAITVQDIDAAIADVHAKGDVDLAALQCYPALKDFLKTNVQLQPPTVDGVITLNQLKRDVLLGGVSKTGPFQMALRKLHTACAAYVMDEQRFAVEMAVLVGAASHGVPPVTALPNVIGAAVQPALKAVIP
jgi:hypothetical protein